MGLRSIRNAEPKWTPETVVVDFEAALFNAVETVFPGVVLRGCYFHYMAAIKKNLEGMPPRIAVMLTFRQRRK